VFTRYGLQKLFGLDCLALTSDQSPLYPDLPSNIVDTKRSTTILSGIQLDFLGCLSTMSTFDAEVYTMRRSGQIARAFIYAASTFMLSFLLAQLSSWIRDRNLLSNSQLVVIVMQSMYLAFKCPSRMLQAHRHLGQHTNIFTKPAQNSASRAELHRKSIINTQSVQDMHIDADPSHVPVVLIEKHGMVVPQHSSNKDLASNASEQKDTVVLPKLQGESLVPKSSAGKKVGASCELSFLCMVFRQGHHLDLRLVRNQWLLLDPGADCLMFEANEDKTSRDFKEMGSRLAGEVIAFLKKKMDKLSRYGGCKELKLSFVGHSIGNIIIRSALAEPALQPYLKNLYTYMSISGPHLGYWYSSNSLFNSGLWLLKKLKNAQCIHQLTFSDDQDPHNTYFYKLCKLKTLENFKNIILLSSPQ
ncbi:hypothetical protein ACJX0J_013623, partial [Zea mays]